MDCKKILKYLVDTSGHINPIKINFAYSFLPILNMPVGRLEASCMAHIVLLWDLLVCTPVAFSPVSAVSPRSPGSAVGNRVQKPHCGRWGWPSETEQGRPLCTYSSEREPRRTSAFAFSKHRVFTLELDATQRPRAHCSPFRFCNSTVRNLASVTLSTLS